MANPESSPVLQWKVFCPCQRVPLERGPDPVNKGERGLLGVWRLFLILGLICVRGFPWFTTLGGCWSWLHGGGFLRLYIVEFVYFVFTVQVWAGGGACLS